MPMQSMYWNGSELEGSKDPSKLPLAGGTIIGSLNIKVLTTDYPVFHEGYACYPIISKLTDSGGSLLYDGNQVGVGDMVKTTYDTNNSGSVDNAEKVGNIEVGQLLRSDTNDTIGGMLSVDLTTNRTAGLYGIYDSAKIGHVWSMGTGYMIDPAGVNFGNTYGMAYKHTNNLTGGTMAGGHQIVFCNAGTPGAAIGLAGGVWTSGNITGSKVYGAVYNDYAEKRKSNCEMTPGTVAIECEDGIIRQSKKRLSKMPMAVSDTYGFLIGEKGDAENPVVPIAVSGRALVHTDRPKGTFKIGDTVCSGINGTASKMTWWEKILFPERILGFVSEIPRYDTWGEEDVKVSGRIWIKVK